MMICARRLARTPILSIVLTLTLAGPGVARIVHAQPAPTAISAGEAAAIKVAVAYRGILGREPESGAAPAAFADALMAGSPTVNLCRTLFDSAEYARERSHLSPQQLTDSLYLGILQRQPDDFGRAQTINAINAGRRAGRAAAMIDSPEFVDRFLDGRDPLAGGDAAIVVSADMPTTMACSTSHAASITMENTGTKPWTADLLKLGAQGDRDPFSDATRVLMSPGTVVLPGQIHTFTFVLQAPAEAGLYATHWQMVREHVRWFGEVAQAAISVQCTPSNDDDAQVVSFDLPASLDCSQSYAASVTVKNTGNTTWTPAVFKLGAVNNEDPFTSFGRVHLPAGTSVPPNGLHTFEFSLTAPSAAGTYVTDWRMVHESVAWFGGVAQSTVSVPCGGGGDDGAEVVAYSLPTSLTCSQSYQASVTVRNNGVTTWTSAGFRLGTVGDSHPLYPTNRVLLPGGVSIAPNETYSFQFTLTAPRAPTTYVTAWQMVHEAVGWFGEVARSDVAVTCTFAEGVEHVDLLLRRDGPDWITLEGDPFDYRQAIPCCGGEDSGWPIAIAPAWQLYTSVRGANVLHMRPGPFLADSESEEWAAIGGAYVEVDGKADLLQWNQLFFDTISGWIYEAGLTGQRVEIGLTDWWRARNALGGTVSHPWLPQYNVQNANFLSGLGRDGHYNGVAMAWLFKVVSEWGRFGNVIFLDGTEISLFFKYSAETTWALRSQVQEWEQGLAYPTHMFGTNGSREAAEGDVDYVAVHGAFPRQSIANKPTVLNEYNGTPPLSPDSWMLLQCETRTSGTDMAYWRGWRPQTRTQMDETFARWQAMDCSFLEEGCFPPDADGLGWGSPISRPAMMKRAINKAKAKLAEPCGKDPILALKAVGLELRKAGHCADQWADAVGIQAPDGLWEEWHLVSFGNGCWTGSPYITAWPHDDR